MINSIFDWQGRLMDPHRSPSSTSPPLALASTAMLSDTPWCDGRLLACRGDASERRTMAETWTAQEGNSMIPGRGSDGLPA